MDSVKYGKLILLLETVHIPLWLFKDLCWLLSYQMLGVMVAVPTILVAILMAWVTRKDKDRFLPNVSIAFWIIANANWMFDEFYAFDTRFYSIYPFMSGILVFVVFLAQKLIKTNHIK